MPLKPPSLFLAFPLSQEMRKAVIASTRSRIPAAMAPLHIEDLHITLAFFGSVMEHAASHALDVAAAALRKEEAEGERDIRGMAFIRSMTFCGVSVFGRGTALVLNLSASPTLGSIRDQALTAAGKSPNHDVYRPHVTFAKTDVILDDASKVEAARATDDFWQIAPYLPPFLVTAVGLYRRAPKDSAVRYQLLREVELR